MTVFKTNDAQWHYSRRAEVIKKDPKIAKYFKPYPLSFGFLCLLAAFRTFCLIKVGLWIGTLPSFLHKYIATWLYVMVVENVLLHSCLTFSHEHSHNLIFQTPVGVTLVDFVSTSFSENLGYVYSHSRYHHPNLGDPETDSECAFKYGDLSKGGIKALMELIALVLPGSVFLKLVQKSPKSRSFPIPKSWWYRKLACHIGSVSSLIFVFYNGGVYATIIQVWALGIYVSPWGIWVKGQSIAEHLTQHHVPTLSTYNPILNLLFFNTGYHDEHHTFPLLPWIYLPMLRKNHPDIFKYDQPTSYFFLWFNWLTSYAPSYRLPRNTEKVAKIMNVDMNKKAADYKAD